MAIKVFKRPPPAPKLLMHFGDFSDSSGNPLVFTATGGTHISNVASKFGGTSLKGTSVGIEEEPGCVYAPLESKIDFSGEFCIDFWFLVESVTQSGGEQVVTFRNDKDVADYNLYSGEGYNIQIQRGGMISVAGGAPGYYIISNSSSGAFYEKDVWHHLAFTKQKKVADNLALFKLFLNGQLVGSEQLPLDNEVAILLDSPTNWVVLGSWTASELGLGFPGYIDEFRVTTGSPVYTDNFTPSSRAFTPADVGTPTIEEFELAGEFSSGSWDGSSWTEEPGYTLSFDYGHANARTVDVLASNDAGVTWVTSSAYLADGLGLYRGTFSGSLTSSLITDSSYASNNVIDDGGLLLHFDNLNDATSNQINFTATANAQISSTTSKFGGTSFEPLDGCIYAPLENKIDLSQDFCIESWFFLNSSQAPNEGTLFCFIDDKDIAVGGTGNTGYEMRISSTRIMVNGTELGNTIVVMDGLSISLDTWHHVAFTKRTTAPQQVEFDLYLDGQSTGIASHIVFDLTDSFLANLLANVTQPRNWLILGAWTANESNSIIFPGCVDEFRITTGDSVYTANFGVPEEPFTITTYPAVQFKYTLNNGLNNVTSSAALNRNDIFPQVQYYYVDALPYDGTSDGSATVMPQNTFVDGDTIEVKTSNPYRKMAGWASDRFNWYVGTDVYATSSAVPVLDCNVTFSYNDWTGTSHIVTSSLADAGYPINQDRFPNIGHTLDDDPTGLNCSPELLARVVAEDVLYSLQYGDKSYINQFPGDLSGSLRTELMLTVPGDSFDMTFEAYKTGQPIDFTVKLTPDTISLPGARENLPSLENKHSLVVGVSKGLANVSGPVPSLVVTNYDDDTATCFNFGYDYADSFVTGTINCGSGPAAVAVSGASIIDEILWVSGTLTYPGVGWSPVRAIVANYGDGTVTIAGLCDATGSIYTPLPEVPINPLFVTPFSGTLVTVGDAGCQPSAIKTEGFSHYYDNGNGEKKCEFAAVINGNNNVGDSGYNIPIIDLSTATIVANLTSDNESEAIDVGFYQRQIDGYFKEVYAIVTSDDGKIRVYKIYDVDTSSFITPQLIKTLTGPDAGNGGFGRNISIDDSYGIINMDWSTGGALVITYENSSNKLALHFDNGITDSSTDPLTFTSVGDMSIDSSVSKFGTSSLYMSGSTSTILKAPIDGKFSIEDYFVVEGWFKLDSDARDERRYLFSFCNDVNGSMVRSGLSLSTQKTNGNLVAALGYSNHDDGSPMDMIINTGFAPSLDEWHHFAVMRLNDDLVKVVCDGEIKGTAALEGVLYTGDYFCVGNAYEAGDAHSFKGYLDEITVFANAGSPDTISPYGKHEWWKITDIEDPYNNWPLYYGPPAGQTGQWGMTRLEQDYNVSSRIITGRDHIQIKRNSVVASGAPDNTLRLYPSYGITKYTLGEPVSRQVNNMGYTSETNSLNADTKSWENTMWVGYDQVDGNGDPITSTGKIFTAGYFSLSADINFDSNAGNFAYAHQLPDSNKTILTAKRIGPDNHIVCLNDDNTITLSRVRMVGG